MGRKKKSASTPSKPATYDIEQVRAYARGRWPEILAAVGGFAHDVLDGNHHACPKCGGTDRFRLIDADAGAVLCNQCGRTGIGDGFAAIGWKDGRKFAEILTQVAEHLGVAPSSSQAYRSNGGGRNADPAEHLELQPWDEGTELLARYWCQHKSPITLAAILAAGGQVARYRGQYTVLALPVWGENWAESEARPVGWCLYNITGGTLPKFHAKAADGSRKPPEQVKVKLTHGSKPGIIANRQRICKPGFTNEQNPCKTIWKLEGPSDLLAFLSLPDLPCDVAAITNANGAKEHPAPWMLELFRGRQALICHDADRPGQDGAAGWPDERTGKQRPGWAPAAATTATTARNVLLPFPIVPDHGPDLRDYLNSGHAYADLQALADDAQPTSPPTEPIAAPALDFLESDDDPHRLARVNLERYAKHREGATLRLWRSEWYTWKQSRGAYRKIEERELRAKVTSSIRSEFEQCWQRKMSAWEKKSKAGETEEPPPNVQKVTKTLVSNVIDATASMVVVSSAADQMTWIDDGQRQRRNYVSMANGILDVESVLAEKDLDECLLPHTPKWFSSICLPYKFDADATCPKWEAFLEKNLELDPERIKILQEWAGYLLLPDTGEQKFLVLEGEGANGKSVYCAAINAMLGGDNCSHIPLELFADRFAKSQTLGKLVNISADVGELDKVAEGYLKSFTSGDVMYFDRKGIPGVDCTPTARLMLACNNRPRFSDRSSGIWRRMLLIPWRITIGSRDRIRNMDKPWWWEQSGELPGIFNWALIGLERLRKQQGFTDSHLSSEALEDYKIESNPARAFLLENLEPTEDGGVKATLIYKLYSKWAVENGYRALGERLFGKEVKRVFPKSDRKRGGNRADRYWYYGNVKFSADEICGERTSEQPLF
jgi:P4 family phage/plasmid primase-like protien